MSRKFLAILMIALPILIAADATDQPEPFQTPGPNIAVADRDRALSLAIDTYRKRVEAIERQYAERLGQLESSDQVQRSNGEKERVAQAIADAQAVVALSQDEKFTIGFVKVGGAAAIPQVVSLAPVPTGTTESALKRNWKATKVREGQVTSLQGVPLREAIYSLSNGATVLVLSGTVDRVFLAPKIGMEEEELLRFNRHHESDGDKPSTKIISETASEIEYAGSSLDGPWQATVDTETHKIISLNQ